MVQNINENRLKILSDFSLTLIGEYQTICSVNYFCLRESIVLSLTNNYFFKSLNYFAAFSMNYVTSLLIINASFKFATFQIQCEKLFYRACVHCIVSMLLIVECLLLSTILVFVVNVCGMVSSYLLFDYCI